MKTLSTILFLIVARIGLSQNFEYDYQNLLSGARNVWDTNDLENAERDAERLADEIDQYIDDNRSRLSSNEITEYNSLMNKSEALDDFIGGVLIGNRNFPVGLDDFKIACSEIGISYSILDSRYCLPVYILEYDGYVALVAINEDKTSGYKIKCGTKNSSGSITSTYEGSLMKYSVRSIQNNRDSPKSKTWYVRSMSCEKINF